MKSMITNTPFFLKYKSSFYTSAVSTTLLYYGTEGVHGGYYLFGGIYAMWSTYVNKFQNLKVTKEFGLRISQ